MCFLQASVAEIQRATIMSGYDEETQGFRVKVFQNINYHEEIAQGFGHFFFINGNKAIVQPVVYEGMATSAAFGLSDFVFVMRENKITAATVEVEAFAQIFHTHGRAFDVPARTAFTPRAGPSRFTRFSSFPQSEVHGISFAVVYVNASASHHIFQITTGKLAVMLEFFYAVIYVTFNLVSIVTVDKGLYGLDDVFDMFRHAGINVSAFYVQLVHYFIVRINVTVANVKPLHAFLVGSVDNLIVDISEVLHMGYVIAFVFQEATDNVPSYEGTSVANVRMVVGSNAANVDVCLAFVNGYKIFLLFR